MRVIVCGGRDYTDRADLWGVLDMLHSARPITFLFHGNARGADTLADEWARTKQHEGMRVFPCPADWGKEGKAAGPKRNQRMLGNAIDLVIAFPGGVGTADMVRRAEKAGVRVFRAPPPGPKWPERPILRGSPSYGCEL